MYVCTYIYTYVQHPPQLAAHGESFPEFLPECRYIFISADPVLVIWYPALLNLRAEADQDSSVKLLNLETPVSNNLTCALGGC